MTERTSFAPETTSPERNERDQSPKKIQQNRRSWPSPPAHNGLVACRAFPNRQLNQSFSAPNIDPTDARPVKHLGCRSARTPRRFTVARQRGAIRPIRTPQLPSSPACALDLFLAAETYDLIASDRSWFGAEVWAASTKRLGTRHLGRQVVETCRAPRSGLARTVACRRLRRSISIRYRAALI